MSRAATGSEKLAFRWGTTFVAAITLTVAYSSAVWHALASHGDTCVVHRLTGWWCPFCGLTHAVVALLNGEAVTALHRNPLALFYVLGLGLAVLMAWIPSIRSGARKIGAELPASTGTLAVLGVVFFTVGRNL